MHSPIAVLGAGSWGTALAIQLARCGNPTRLWGRDPEQLTQMAAERRNKRYLPSVDQDFPATLTPQADFAAAVDGCRNVLISTPSHAFRETLEALAPLLPADGRVVWATKGLDHDSGRLLHELAGEVLGPERALAIVSGPTFAHEVAMGLPAALTVAATDPAFADDLVTRLHGHAFRVYTNDDIIGVQLGGAVKNVLALAAGIADGLGFGANTRAALITRGLGEMTRLGLKMGGQRETFMALAGLGDLILTSTDNQSRNRRMGLALATGQGIEAAAAEIGQVVEGIATTGLVWGLACKHQVSMPITEQVQAVIQDGRPPRDAVAALISRAPKQELD